VLDLLLPRRCVVCRGGGGPLCVHCRDALPALTPPLCALCGAPTAWAVERCRECSGRRLAFASARAAVAYDDEVRRLVHAWKERGLRALADAAAELVVERVPRPSAGVVTFVPGDAWRTRGRGHHPAERLARAVAERWELPCTRLLRRAGGAPRQRGLTVAERRTNVRHAFAALGTAPESAILIDDIYTTGSTANAVASALRTRVDVVTFARALSTRREYAGGGAGRPPPRGAPPRRPR
jgi:predicted amidophosphoribosyltransferase